MNKIERAKNAQQHTQEMQQKYSKEIAKSIAGSKIYTEMPEIKTQNLTTQVDIVAMDTVSALYMYKTTYTHIALLNFASYTHAGGGYMLGSIAQEECLCQESDLYNILNAFEAEYYQKNRADMHDGLYSNRGIYIPQVVFCKDGCTETVSADVITVAAPNKNRSNGKVTNEEQRKALRSRIDFLLGMGATNEVELLILGAFGCGAFGQNPIEVASIFKELLETKYKGVYKQIVYAIPLNVKNNNLEAFETVYQQKHYV